MVKPVANGEATPEPVIDPLDRPDSAEPAHVLRDRLTALTNALNVVRLAAGNDPRVSAALDVADRQVMALAARTDGLHGQGRGRGTPG